MSNLNQPRALPSYETITVAAKGRPWITMVHGASQTREVFSAQIQHFSPDYRLLLIDLPGHGKSAAMPGPYGLAEHAEGVLAAMDDAGVQETHFWGTHTGAGVGLLLANRYAKRFTSLMLEGAVIPGAELPSVSKNLGRAKATAHSQGIEAARLEWFEQSEWFDVIRQNPTQCRAQDHWAMLLDFAGAPWLDVSTPKSVAPMLDDSTHIVQPVLLVNGEHDLAEFLQIADTLERRLPNAQRVIIPDAGGFPLWEFPEPVAEHVHRFLRDLDR